MQKHNSYGAVSALESGNNMLSPGSDDSWDLNPDSPSKYQLSGSHKSDSKTSKASRWVFAVVLVALVSVLGYVSSSAERLTSAKAGFRSIYNFIGTKTGLAGDGISTDSTDLDFTTSRDGYDPLVYFTPIGVEMINYKILDGFDGLIEPYSDMNVFIFGSADDKYYSYTVCSDKDSSQCYSGIYYTISSLTSTPVNIPCAAYDTYSITVNELSSSNDQILRTATGKLLCMYVRREIRTLTDADLDKTMDAMYTLWSTNEVQGQQIYGPSYHSSTYHLEAHYFNAAWQDADHIHEGNGFLPQHIKMTNTFEESMQAVDPSVALPYWDFTIESAQNVSVMLSPVFTDKMFGTMPRSKDQYWGWTYRNDSVLAGAIQDSRWAFIKADKNDKYADLNFAYGYLRAPWNMNPSPYLSRYTSTNKHLPSCSSHYTLLGYDQVTDFLFESPYAAHAATHGTIGGVFGCDMFDEMKSQGYILSDEGQLNLCKNWIFYLKEFYRLDYLVPNSNCSVYQGTYDAEDFNCGFTCNDALTKDFIFELKNILNSDYDCVPYDMQDVGWFAWKDFICFGDGYKVFGGDHLEAASPADPSFWPIHPTLERVLQAKYMAGGFDDNEWPSDPTVEYVCDKASCYDEVNGFGYWDTCCYGHYGDDQMYDAGVGDKVTGSGMTNKEVMEATDPTSEDYSMPYIYADFYWDHCTSVGYDFMELMDTMYNEADSDSSDTTSEESDSTTDTTDVTSDTTDTTVTTDTTTVTTDTTTVVSSDINVVSVVPDISMGGKPSTNTGPSTTTTSTTSTTNTNNNNNNNNSPQSSSGRSSSRSSSKDSSTSSSSSKKSTSSKPSSSSSKSSSKSSSSSSSSKSTSSSSKKSSNKSSKSSARRLLEREMVGTRRVRPL